LRHTAERHFRRIRSQAGSNRGQQPTTPPFDRVVLSANDEVVNLHLGGEGRHRSEARRRPYRGDGRKGPWPSVDKSRDLPQCRTHASCARQGCAARRPAQKLGRIMSVPWLGGLHHQYVWMANRQAHWIFCSHNYFDNLITRSRQLVRPPPFQPTTAGRPIVWPISGLPVRREPSARVGANAPLLPGHPQ
jgi:hypothetical protein